MQKSDYLQQKKLNPADELRDHLFRLEQSPPNIKTMASEQALQMMYDLDQTQHLFEQLGDSGVDLFAEQSRFVALQTRLKKIASPWLRRLGGPSVLGQARADVSPASDRWWWYIDRIVADQQRRLWRNLGVGIGIFFVVLIGVYTLFNTILAPSPEVIARLDAENEADAAMELGNYQEGVTALETGLAVVPDDPRLLVYHGIMLKMVGNDEAAERSFQLAQDVLSDTPFDFYVMRSQLYLRTGQPELAEADVRYVLEQDNAIASAWLILGQSLELQGRNLAAIEAYQIASEIAFENGESEIVVLARVALGQLGVSAPQ